MLDGFSTMDGFRFRKLKGADNVAWNMNDDSLYIPSASAHVVAHTSESNVDDVEMIISGAPDNNSAVSVRPSFPHTEQNGKCL